MTSMAAVWTCRWFDKHYGKGDAAQEEEYRRNAAAWAEKAAENGSAAACYMLAEKLNNPSDEKARKKAWFRWMARGAELGDPPMQWELGRGCLREKRYAEAEKWLRLAANNGHWRALVDMARLCIDTGRYAEAETWHGKAEAAEHLDMDSDSWRMESLAEDAVRACGEAGEKAWQLKWRIRLAELLEKRNPATAAATGTSSSAKLAVEGGFFGSSDYDARRLARLQYEIAKTLHWGATEQDGDGNWTKTVKPDVRKAMKWYAKAAGRGHYESLNTLCEYYYRNNVLEEAAKHLETGEKIKGEHQGRMKYLLARCLIIRDGKQIGYRSNKLMEEAAELGDPEASYILKGRGTRKKTGRE